jgi:cob(I)alamin adenosyltransferase
MATNKVKRSIHLAQPQAPQLNHKPVDLTPVKSHVYQAIAELNAGLEKAIHNLQMLQSNQLFGASGLTAMNHVLRGVRARANRQLMMALNEREAANAGHFQQICMEPENR